MDCMAHQPLKAALRPPSMVRIQLLAYELVARKAAASATSSALPTRPSGICFDNFDLSRPACRLASKPLY